LSKGEVLFICWIYSKKTPAWLNEKL
jgi:hypothetical protein